MQFVRFSSPARDGTGSLYWEHRVSATGPPGKSLPQFFEQSSLIAFALLFFPLFSCVNIPKSISLLTSESPRALLIFIFSGLDTTLSTKGHLSKCLFLGVRRGRCCCSVAKGEIRGSPRPHITGQSWLYAGGWQLPVNLPVKTPAQPAWKLPEASDLGLPSALHLQSLCLLSAVSFYSLLLCPFSFSRLRNNRDLQPQTQIPFPIVFRSFTVSLIITFGLKQAFSCSVSCLRAKLGSTKHVTVQ